MDDADPLGLIGTTIDDKYVVEAMVGVGGFAVVYRALHKLWKKPVALKFFRALSDAAPAMREKLLADFVQEGALLTELSARSASIVQARDLGTLTTADGAWIPYMVLEWLEGATLEAVFEDGRRGAFDLEVAMAILEPVAEALELAHRRSIAHRDVKPSNVFLVGALPVPGTASAERAEFHVKLLDFGIAKVVSAAADQGFTKTGGHVTSFTPAYGAPEQFSRAQGATGPWTDVYALALIFSELVSGRAALEGEDFIQLGMSSADPQRRPTPRALGASVSDGIEAVCAKALAVRPTDRWPSAGAFWNALRSAIGQAPMRRLQTTPLDPRSVRGAHAATELAPEEHQSASKLTPAAIARELTDPRAAAKPSKLPWIAGAGVLVAAAAAFVFARARGPKDLPDGPIQTAVTAASVPPIAASAAPAATGPRCPEGMVAIEGGKFFMGSDHGEEHERPAHQVTLAPYCIDVHEVTVEAYKACSDKGECKRAWAVVDWPDVTDRERKIYTPLCNVNDPVGRARHPVNCVDWQHAVTYCESLGKRLPTEAEWEFAARGPDGRIYPWGDETPDESRLNACGKECLAWAKRVGEPLVAMHAGDDSWPHTAPVGSFPKGASRYGLLDVVGNVWEWTADWHGSYESAAQANPKGPTSGEERVVRGGAWNGAYPSWVRPSYRYAFPPETRSHAVGFRCAKEPSGT
jgi:formylglycine-generating enzyme required for sulfatase activity